MKYYFYIDESGDHSLQNINQDFPYFLLCGILISEEELLKLDANMNKIKTEIFGSEKVIFHSRDIRKHEGHFVKLFNDGIKKEFYERLNKIMIETDFVIISNVVMKEDYLKKFGKSAINPYHISLSSILATMIDCSDEKNVSSIEIFAEMRGGKEDRMLLNHYNSILDTGTYYVNANKFKGLIANFTFRSKKENDIGIQLADLCAYPLSSYIRSRDETNPSYKILYPKIYRSPKDGTLSGLTEMP